MPSNSSSNQDRDPGKSSPNKRTEELVQLLPRYDGPVPTLTRLRTMTITLLHVVGHSLRVSCDIPLMWPSLLT